MKKSKLIALCALTSLSSSSCRKDSNEAVSDAQNSRLDSISHSSGHDEHDGISRIIENPAPIENPELSMDSSKSQVDHHEFMESLLLNLEVEVINMGSHSNKLFSHLMRGDLHDYIRFLENHADRIGNKQVLSNKMLTWLSRTNAEDVMRIKEDPEALELLGLESARIPEIVSRGLIEGLNERNYDLISKINKLEYDDGNIMSIPDGFFSAHGVETDFADLAPVIRFIHDGFPNHSGAFDHMVFYSSTRHPKETLEYIISNDLPVSEQTLNSVCRSLYRADAIGALNYVDSWPKDDMQARVMNDLLSMLSRENPIQYRKWKDSISEGK